MATKVTGILGKKVGMTQLLTRRAMCAGHGAAGGPCVVTQHKLAVKDGYEARQIGLVEL